MYGAVSMTRLTITTVVLEFKDISQAEITIANTGKLHTGGIWCFSFSFFFSFYFIYLLLIADKTSIGGQKISCRFPTVEELQTYENVCFGLFRFIFKYLVYRQNKIKNYKRTCNN
jgi:hypothetical protein